MRRLDSGGDIDREMPVEFRFDGRTYTGLAGDTLASALLANEVRVVARSFKYHRPRGIVSAGIEETNALVQVLGRGEEPNVRATMLPITDGLETASINCWPGPRFDFGAVAGALAPLIPAGFYYKTFLWRNWDFYSRFIRRMAGLGRVPRSIDHGRYERVHRHVDVLVVGAGPAGLAAARDAACGGARVLLVDAGDRPGGRLLVDDTSIDGMPGRTWVDRMTADLDALPNLTRMATTVATGCYDHNMVLAAELSPRESWVRERLWHIRARHVIFATGAVERPLVFSNNDRPGVMLSGSAQTYVRRFAVAPGRRAVVFTNNSGAYACAAVLHDAGIEVAAIVDSRGSVDDAERRVAGDRGIVLHGGHVVANVRGRAAVKAVRIAPLAGGRERELDCDLLCVSGGWNPLVHLDSHTGSNPVYDETSAAFIAGHATEGRDAAGSVRGLFDTAAVIADGIRAGVDAARRLGHAAREEPKTVAADDIPYRIEPLWEVGVRRGKAFVDLQNDVTVDDIRLCLRENLLSVEHVKRYTTAGMATDQGKMGNANVIGVLASAAGNDPRSTGTTTYRPPFVPISFGVIAGLERGPLVLAARTTPITAWNIEQGAVMTEAGASFRRPLYYPRRGETIGQAVRREAFAVRNGAGIYDGTPLGKFELHGADVPEFLNRIYTNRFDDLAIGCGRYGLMLREDGRLFDDGVTFRLGEDEYLMYCSTGAAPAVLGHIERLLQTQWPELDVYPVDVSAQWANVCVCGPRAREVLAAAGTEIDLSGNFGFMHMRQGEVAGSDARVARVSYTGELSFEINVRRRNGRALWESLMAAGRPFDITPVGSETSAVLRIEKGFVSPAIEGDNITNPDDAGLAWLVDMNKGDFIGRRSLVRDRRLDGVREHVVGLVPVDPRFVPAEGAALLPAGGRSDYQGHVTASCFSPTLERAIAIGLLKNGHDRHGETVSIHAPDGSCEAEVASPAFYDPSGESMRS